MTETTTDSNTKMVFEVIGKNTLGRLGKLSLGNKVVTTPSLVVSTTRMCVPHLTPDTFHRSMDKESFAALGIEMEALLEDNCVLPKTSPMPLSDLFGYGSDTPTIFGMNEHLYYGGNVKCQKSGQELALKNGLDWISVFTSNGVCTLSAPEHVNLFSKLRPSAIIAPSDHYPTKNARLKRIRKSTEVSEKLFEVCQKVDGEQISVPFLNLHTENGEAEEKQSYVQTEMQRRLAWIAGNNECSLVATSKESVLSFIEKDEFRSILKSNTIFVRGPVTPEEILLLSKMGVDLFETFYATDCATKGQALNIRFENENVVTEVLELKDPSFFEQFLPLDDTCQCIACAGSDKTTRSYIHHLHMNHEMLGHVFLASHNLWQYSNLVSWIKKNRQDQ